MDRSDSQYHAFLKDWYAGLLEEGWLMIDGPYPTFTKNNYFIEFDPVSLISPDRLGLWIYAVKDGNLTERLGVGSDQLNDSIFPVIELPTGQAFNVATLELI